MWDHGEQDSEAEKEQKAVTIRTCRPADLPIVAKLAARLVREHHRMDPERFFTSDSVEEGYRSYLSSELEREKSVVLVGVEERTVIGYAYGRIEPRDWNTLREECGALHDIYVDERARRKGVATLLIEAMIHRLAQLGATRVVLMTAAENRAAHRLFERLGFRITMLEMMKDSEERMNTGEKPD
jgi:ribosomal protein S18 acetylase RimI-like enzyme